MMVTVMSVNAVRTLGACPKLWPPLPKEWPNLRFLQTKDVRTGPTAATSDEPHISKQLLNVPSCHRHGVHLGTSTKIPLLQRIFSLALELRYDSASVTALSGPCIDT